jgi:hypothetical protein
VPSARAIQVQSGLSAEQLKAATGVLGQFADQVRALASAGQIPPGLPPPMVDAIRRLWNGQPVVTRAGGVTAIIEPPRGYASEAGSLSDYATSAELGDLGRRGERRGARWKDTGHRRRYSSRPARQSAPSPVYFAPQPAPPPRQPDAPPIPLHHADEARQPMFEQYPVVDATIPGSQGNFVVRFNLDEPVRATNLAEISSQFSALFGALPTEADFGMILGAHDALGAARRRGGGRGGGARPHGRKGGKARGGGGRRRRGGGGRAAVSPAPSPTTTTPTPETVAKQPDAVSVGSGSPVAQQEQQRGPCPQGYVPDPRSGQCNPGSLVTTTSDVSQPDNNCAAGSKWMVIPAGHPFAGQYRCVPFRTIVGGDGQPRTSFFFDKSTEKPTKPPSGPPVCLPGFVPGPDGLTCIPAYKPPGPCPTGFTFGPDGLTCIPVGYGGYGGYNPYGPPGACPPGFMLGPDGRTCMPAPGAPAGMVPPPPPGGGGAAGGPPPMATGPMPSSSGLEEEEEEESGGGEDESIEVEDEEALEGLSPLGIFG